MAKIDGVVDQLLKLLASEQTTGKVAPENETLNEQKATTQCSVEQSEGDTDEVRIDLLSASEDTMVVDSDEDSETKRTPSSQKGHRRLKKLTSNTGDTKGSTTDTNPTGADCVIIDDDDDDDLEFFSPTARWRRTDGRPCSKASHDESTSLTRTLALDEDDEDIILFDKIDRTRNKEAKKTNSGNKFGASKQSAEWTSLFHSKQTKKRAKRASNSGSKLPEPKKRRLRAGAKLVVFAHHKVSVDARSSGST
jgi:hypothetical protein